MPISVTKQQARRFLLYHQHLLPHSNANLKGVDDVFRYFRLLQHDPLNPCGRNIDLIIQSRLPDYKVGDYATWLYDERKGIEGFDKMMCVVPREDYPYLRLLSRLNFVSSERHRFMTEHRAELDLLLSTIRANGPVSSRDLLDERRLPIGWSDNHWGAVALESLWRNGEIVICHRQGNQRFYDLPERVLGDIAFTEPSLSSHILRRLGAVGLLPSSGGGSGWLGAGGSGVLRSEIKQMVDLGQLVEVHVDGVATKYIIRVEDADALRNADGILAPSEMRFIAPLDNLMWDRRMIAELFDFDYKWEVYVPASQRKYGYYVLPLLYRDQFVGRIEPVLKNGVLEVRGLWKEEGANWNSQMKRALDTRLEQFMTYLGIKVQTSSSHTRPVGI